MTTPTLHAMPQPQSGDQKLAQRVSAGLAACNASPEAACNANAQPQSGDQKLAQRVSAGLAANHDSSPGGAAQEAVSCVLFYQAGTSDKEYHLALEPAPAGNAWNVNALYGRRGGNLKPATKTAAPVDYATALNIYERVKKEKLSEGYRESTAPVAAFSPITRSPDHPITCDLVVPELLTPIEIADVGKYILDNRYWIQEKADGDRSPVRRSGTGSPEAPCNGFTRYNRKGQPKPLPSSLAAALATTTQTEWLLDGEIEGEQLWIFSALESGGVDLRSRPFAERYRHAQDILAHVAQPPSAVILLPVATTAEEKEAFIRRMIAENAEGVVIVDSHAAFKPGRAGQHFKLKFVKTCTVRVRCHHKDGKRSVEIELLNSNGTWVEFGSVSYPAKYGPLPEPGTLLEIRYLYAHGGEQGGSLNQPVYLRRRDDLDPSAATISQLTFKRGEE